MTEAQRPAGATSTPPEVRPLSADHPVASPSSTTCRLVVCIVNWRAADLTLDCLRSLEPELASFPGSYALVVDNDSQDGSAEKLEAGIGENGWGAWARLRRSPTNGGFAAGNNVALREALRAEVAPDFVLLLNPDTIVRPQALQILVDFLAAHPEVGIAGGRSEDPDTTPQDCCFRFPTLASEFAGYLGVRLVMRLLRKYVTSVPTPTGPREIDWVSGAHMIVRREVFDAVGIMDEGYFLYYEETDFTLQARRAGWSCWHVPTSRIVHLVGQSTGLSSRDDRPRRRPAYWFESRTRYFVLNHGRSYAIATDLLATLALTLGRLKAFVLRRPRAEPPHFLRDLLRHSALFRSRRGMLPRRNQL